MKVILKSQRPGAFRNGHGSNRMTGDDGEMEIIIPRDHEARLEPKMICG
ncbi:MAG: hypothetical protein V7750_14455 [Sneathiella sp.]